MLYFFLVNLLVLFIIGGYGFWEIINRSTTKRNTLMSIWMVEYIIGFLIFLYL